MNSLHFARNKIPFYALLRKRDILIKIFRRTEQKNGHNYCRVKNRALRCDVASYNVVPSLDTTFDVYFEFRSTREITIPRDVLSQNLKQIAEMTPDVLPDVRGVIR